MSFESGGGLFARLVVWSEYFLSQLTEIEHIENSGNEVAITQGSAVCMVGLGLSFILRIL